jgi:hypothetical protein
MAAAVVGPPTFAFEAKYSSRGGNLKIPRPSVMSVQKWTKICNAEKAKRDGAFFKTNWIDPAAPDDAKNI